MDGDSRIWWWFGDKFNALIKNPNGKDLIEGDVLVTSPLWINEKPKFQEHGIFYFKLVITFYSWMVTAEFDDDLVISPTFGSRSRMVTIR